MLVPPKDEFNQPHPFSLRYMYCDELSSEDKLNEIAVIYQLSDKYKVIGLCEREIAQTLRIHALDRKRADLDYQLLCMQSLVPTRQLTNLTEQALDIIKMHTFLVFQSSPFRQIRKATPIIKPND